MGVNATCCNFQQIVWLQIRSVLKSPSPTPPIFKCLKFLSWCWNPPHSIDNIYIFIPDLVFVLFFSLKHSKSTTTENRVHFAVERLPMNPDNAAAVHVQEAKGAHLPCSYLPHTSVLSVTASPSRWQQWVDVRIRGRVARSSECVAQEAQRDNRMFLKQWHLLLKCTFYMEKSHK